MPSYAGAPRLFVPTKRSQAREGERLKIKVVVLDNERPQSATLYWRHLGEGAWQERPLTHVARAVHTATLPAIGQTSVEYHIKVRAASGVTLRWPATAPELNQTVVVIPSDSTD